MLPLDPIAFSIGPLAIRWYSLAYIVGILGGWWLMIKLSERAKSQFTPSLISDFIAYAVVGIILGARLGYILFYNPHFYFTHPTEIIALWHGGMSFHGGLLGVVTAALIFAKVKKISFFAMTDILALVAPLGLMLGRIANFINGELYGKVAPDLPWAVSFPAGGGVPRHPSQLYESALEGLLPLLVFIALWLFVPFVSKHKGFISGVFLVWYSLARSAVELVRVPDSQLGYFLGYITMGQILCLPLFIAGLLIIAFALKHKEKGEEKNKTKKG